MPSFEKHRLGQTLFMLQQDFQRRLDADLAEHGFEGIRSRHRVVFMHLARHGASRSVDLAAAAGIRAQSMMKIVHELETLGLVKRREDPDDSRAKLIEFTTRGQAHIEVLTQATEAVWNQYAQLIGHSELNKSFNTLTQLLTLSTERQNP